MNDYRVTKSLREGVEIYRLSESDDVYAEVAPALGNNCFAFHAGGPILEPVAFETFREKPTSYGIPILFPFPNRVSEGAFRFRGKTYPVNPPRHGFVRDKAWEVLNASASKQDGARVTSVIDSATYPDSIGTQFPFPFRVEVTYRLFERTLTMTTVVFNTGESDFPFGYGIHPYFHKPESGTITVPADKRWELVDAIPTGKLLSVEPALDLRKPRDLAGFTVDDIYAELIADSTGRVSCSLADDSGRATVVAFDKSTFPHAVIYTTPAPRRALCIEPYTCPTDVFNLQDRGIDANLLVLPPGKSVSMVIDMIARQAP